MSYEIFYTKQARKDYEKVEKFPALLKNVRKVIGVLKENPFQRPYEKIVGTSDTYSRRINIQHRLVYEVVDEKTIKVIRMWTHYE